MHGITFLAAWILFWNYSAAQGYELQVPEMKGAELQEYVAPELDESKEPSHTKKATAPVVEKLRSKSAKRVVKKMIGKFLMPKKLIREAETNQSADLTLGWFLIGWAAIFLVAWALFTRILFFPVLGKIFIIAAAVLFVIGIIALFAELMA